MRHRAFLCLFLLSCLGTTPRPQPSKPPVFTRSPEIHNLLNEANKLFTAAEYEKARKLYTSGLESLNASNAFDRTSFQIGIASCHLATQNYPAALIAYAEAEKSAVEAGLQDHLIIIAANRASVYRRMDDFRSARAAIERVEKQLAASNNPSHATHVGSVLSDIDSRSAVPLFHAAIRSASEKGDLSAAAQAWMQLGSTHLKRKDLDNADVALSEGFRLRLMTGGKQLQSCYFHLGRLRRLQGRYAEAVTLLRRALAISGKPGAPIFTPYIHHQLARALLAQGDHSAALTEFETAVQRTAELRLQFLPSDSFRITAETGLQRIFADYISAGMQQYRQSGQEQISRRMFEVSEDSRTALFDQNVNKGRELPPEYYQLLTRYQRALAVSLGSAESQESSSLSKLRLELADAEARLGIRTAQHEYSHQKSERDSPGTALSGLQRKLKRNEALLSFHSGSTESFLWALTRDGFETHVLPSQAAIEARVREFRDSVIQRERGTGEKGSALSLMLFGGLSAAVRQKPRWIVSLDGPLFDLPLAALPGVSGSGYLIEAHAIRAIPGAFIDEGGAPAGIDGRFIGVGDARYNGADPRWRPAPDKVTGPELARLPGTAREIRLCARAWGRDPDPLLLTGEGVSRESVSRVMELKPAILHMAAHVIPHPQMPDQVLVALGLQAGGIGDYLSPADIAAQRRPLGLVTLSGCGSGSGLALPGLGLFGLTRAWLLSGASAVVATHWPIADDSGELLSAMYEELRRAPGPITGSSVAEALRTAQLRMARSRGWRSDPAYWAAFAVVGKD